MAEYVQYIAWLNTSPEWPKDPKKPHERAPEPARRVQIEEAGGTVLLPPLDFGRHLVEYLFRLGPVSKDAAVEPDAMPGWEYALGVEFEPWEMQALIHLSRAYHTEMHAARDWHRLPPYRGVANQWKAVRREQAKENLVRMKQDAKAAAEAEKSRVRTKGKTRDGDRQ